MKKITRLALVCPVLLFYGFPALAQLSESRLADMNDPDYAVREAATAALLLDESLTTEQLATWYSGTASLEARQRLVAVARHHFLRRMRLIYGARQHFLRTRQLAWQPADRAGSIGVVQSLQIEPARPRAAVDNNPDARLGARTRAYALVTRVLDGFPAAGRLQPLDRIVALDGRTLGTVANNQRFEDLIRRYRAHQTLKLTVERNHETLDIEIPLANGDALAAMYAFPGFALTAEFNQAWTAYRQAHFSPR